MKRLLATLIPVLVLCASVSLAQTEKIVFHANYDGSDFEIYMINPDGSGLVQLTDNNVHDEMPSFSRDGSMIVFVSSRDGSRDIYVMSSLGANPRRITNSTVPERFPEFSPDGTKIVFDHPDGSLVNRIAIVDLNGSMLATLTEGSRFDQEPSFSPDGSAIVFVSLVEGRYRIFRMNADGGERTPLTDGITHAFGPSFRPDGQAIIYYDEHESIWEMTPEGAGIASTGLAAGKWVAYSPDGKKIISLLEDQFNSADLLTYELNTWNGAVKITDSAAREFMPSWTSIGSGQCPAVPGIPSLTTRPVSLDQVQTITTKIATAADDSTPAQDLVASVFGPSYLNGVSISNLVVDAAGDVTATVSAVAWATDTSFIIRVADASGAYQHALLNVTVVDVGLGDTGDKIAFHSEGKIFVMNADGTGIKQIAEGDSPSISYDGRKIVFRAGFEIYIVNSDGSGLRRVTDNDLGEYYPSFSPDGTKIVFEAVISGGSSEIFTVDENGANLTRITYDEYRDSYPSFSPDGSEIVYVSLRETAKSQVFIMNANGSEPTPITDGSIEPIRPSFSPDGTSVLYTLMYPSISMSDPIFNYVEMKLDGSGGSSGPGGKNAAWSSDGTKVVFESEGDIYSQRPGTFEGTVRLTKGTGFEGWPSWGGNRAVLPPPPPQDTTSPVITPTVSGPLGENGWYVGDVSLSWNVSDGESEVSERTGCDEQIVNSDTSGITFTCTAISSGGTAFQSVTIKRDSVGPTLQPTLSPSTLFLGDEATAEPNAMDAASGLMNASCGEIDPSIVGAKSVECTATDKAGNTSTASVGYSVLYRFAGFFQPIDNLPALNVAAAGSSIPVKFSLSGNHGLNIFVGGAPVSGSVGCDSTATVTTIEETVNAGGSSLSYDPVTDRYTYVWKTARNWKGSCRQLLVRLNDGSVYAANFRFK